MVAARPWAIYWRERPELMIKEEQMDSYPENIDRVSCPFCGEGNEKGSRFCIHCGKSFPGKKRFRSASRYVLAGIGLILVGMFAFFWMHNLESREVGKGQRREDQQGRVLKEDRPGEKIRMSTGTGKTFFRVKQAEKI